MDDYAYRLDIGRSITAYFLNCLDRFRNGKVRFVEIGANDGVSEDLVFPFASRGAWRGAMIEPVPYLFDRLVTNYAKLPKVKPLNWLVGEGAGMAPFYWFEDDGGMGRYLGSLNRDVIMRHAVHIPDIETKLQMTELQTVPIADIHTATGMKTVDLVVTDTEGYDKNLLHAFDFARPPLLYIMESKHLGWHDLIDCDEKMEALGYTPVSAFEDRIYVGPKIMEAYGRGRFFRRATEGAAIIFG